jgi:hypothetical protein
MGEQTAAEMSIIGAFAPRLTSSEWLTMELAIKELGTSFPALQLRPPVLVLCDDDSAAVTRGVEHLVDQLQSRTLLTSLEERSLNLATAVAADSGALLLSPYGYSTRAAATDAEQGRLWYMGSSYSLAVDVYLAVLDRILDVLASGGKSRDRARVAVIMAETLEDSTQATSLRQALGIDGKDAELLEREGRYLEVVLPDADEASRDEQMASLLSFAPDVVLSLMGGTFANGVRADRVGRLVTLDASLAEVGVRPHYVFGPRSGNEPSLTAVMRADPSLRSRSLLVDTGPGPVAPLADELANRFEQSFPAVAMTDGYAPVPSIYDSVYLLALVQAVSEAAPDGVPSDLLHAGFEHFTADVGPRIDMTPELESMALALTSGTNLNVRGASGDWVFTADRERSGSPSVRCWNERGSLEQAALYDAAGSGWVAIENECSAGGVLGNP